MSYAAAFLYASCAAVAVVPPIFGAEPFTSYWMRRAYPLWLQRGASFERVSRRLALLWAAVFIALTSTSILWPTSTFTMWPVYVAVIGLIAGPLSGVYPTAWIYRAGLKKASAEIFILGLPLIFNRDSEPGLDLSAQFVVSGGEPGSYYVAINHGRCTSGQGDLKHPSLTIYCSTESWSLVGSGELSPERAVDGGLLRVSGSARDFSQFFLCFRFANPRHAARAEYSQKSRSLTAATIAAKSEPR